MSENLVLRIGQKQDEIRTMLAELEDMVQELENEPNKTVDDIEDIIYGFYDEEKDINKIVGRLEGIKDEMEED